NLERQNIEVDAWLDLQTNAIKGPGITLKTDYFILAEGPNYDNTQTLDIKDEKVGIKQKTNEKMEEMRKEAVKKGVTIIPLHKFPLMTGYRMPRTTRAASPGDYASDTSPPKEKGDEEEKPNKNEKKGEKKLGEDEKKMDEKKDPKKKKKDDEDEKE